MLFFFSKKSLKFFLNILAIFPVHRLHDTNNDTHLDGIEIMQAMAHMLPVPELQLQEKLGKSKEQIEQIMDERRKGMMKYYEGTVLMCPFVVHYQCAK